MRRAIPLAAAFLVLTAAVQAGLLRSADRYAIHHLQPLADTSIALTVAPADPVTALRPILRGERSFLVSAAALAFAPADTLSAIVLVAGASVLFVRRDRPRAAVAWPAALAAALAIEGLGKLYVSQIQFAPVTVIFGVTVNGSYPSGHTTRSVLLAALAAVLWPRARPWVIAWVLFVTSVLELGGLHVPSDIAGGFLVGGCLACAAIACGGGATRAVTPDPAVQSGGHAPAQASRPADVQAPPGAADTGRR